MPNSQITSLNSSQVERVKALLHSRGKKVRRETLEFVVDSFQAVCVALNSAKTGFPTIKALFLTQNGLERLGNAGIEIPADLFTEELPHALDYTLVPAARCGPDAADVRRAAEALAHDPALLDRIETRLFDLRGLARKHQVAPDDDLPVEGL